VPRGFACAQAADGFAVFDYIRHNVNFGMPFDEAAAGFLNRSPIEISEFSAEGNEIFVVQLLAAEQENGMVEPGLMDGGKMDVVNRSQIDPLNFGA
jgi:hypothetical protein